MHHLKSPILRNDTTFGAPFDRELSSIPVAFNFGAVYGVGGPGESIMDYKKHIPRPPKGSKKWNPLIIPLFPQCSNGFILGVPFFGIPEGVG